MRHEGEAPLKPEVRGVIGLKAKWTTAPSARDFAVPACWNYPATTHMFSEIAVEPTPDTVQAQASHHFIAEAMLIENPLHLRIARVLVRLAVTPGPYRPRV